VFCVGCSGVGSLWYKKTKNLELGFDSPYVISILFEFVYVVFALEN
jgi:hypothetical protein